MITIIPYSSNAALIQWDGPIHKNTISEVSELNKKIQVSGILSITETIPAFTSITVCYKDSNFSDIKLELEKLYSQLHTSEIEIHHRQWNLPMLPSSSLGETVTKYLSMSAEQFLDTFYDIKFTIGMKGFLPGFLYLAGLPEHMYIPRKSTPDRSIVKGSIAIGGAQCGIYPMESPGGWNVIGNCPIPTIDFTNEDLSAFAIGDVVSFHLIDSGQAEIYDKRDWTLDQIRKEFVAK